MNQIKTKIDYVLKHNIIVQKTFKYIFSAGFKIIGSVIKTDEKMILFNAHGWRYNDSPRAIFEYMINNKKYQDFKFVWALDKPEQYMIPNARKVKIDTFNYFMVALKSKYWVSCVNIERGLNFKKKETIYLNTWHGTPLKLVGNAVDKRSDFDFSDINIFCYSGKYEKEIYVRDFNVSKNSLLLSGLPRNDELYHKPNNSSLNFRQKFNIPKDKKIILYAPTWRDSKDSGKSYVINPPIDVSFLQDELGEEYVLFLRTHAYTNKVMNIKFNEFVYDFSTYPEINDLLISADILISDYSATIFDYSILEKPIICFAYDFDQYMGERGLYINLEKELSNNIVKTQNELIYKIKNMNYEEECKITTKFKEKYLEVGGNATEICVERLFEKLKRDGD